MMTCARCCKTKPDREFTITDRWFGNMCTDCVNLEHIDWMFSKW